MRILVLLGLIVMVTYLTIEPIEANDTTSPEVKELFQKHKRQPRDYSLILGPDGCKLCHRKEFEVWQRTDHYKTLDKLSNSPKTDKIMKNLGLSGTPRRKDLCIDCHYTRLDFEGRTRTIAGVSCEMCHNPGMEWMGIHNDYGDEDTDRNSETPEHRKERHRLSEAEGMIRPANLYKLTEGCYQCHIMNDEKLVNVGGHPTGGYLELVTAIQNNIRHNYTMTPGGASNRLSPVERRRVMYVTGLMLNLEYSLRAFAKAKEEGEYSKTMVRNAKISIAYLAKVLKQTPIKEIQQLFKSLSDVKLVVNQPGLLEAADQVAVAAINFSQNHDGTALSAIDSLIPEVKE